MKNKKSVMGQVISVFVLVLVISILAGLTFLFVSQLKDNVYDSSPIETMTVLNEISFINFSGDYLNNYQSFGFRNPVILGAWNSSSNKSIVSANWTLASDGKWVNATGILWPELKVNYTYDRISNPNSYEAVNDTETAGATVVNYLPLIFLALIFGAILTLVLKIILPYINLGQTMGGFGNNQFGGEY